eukprot:m.85023 g.85023  ORF g.85023 m.85023 type:complete len:260 (+) comp12768_c0_seq2:70-849(+)
MEGHEGVGVGVGVDGEGSNDGAEVAVARSAEESIEAEVKDVAQAFGYLRVDSGEADVGTESVGAISSLELDEFRRQWKAELDHELGAKAEHPLDAGLSGPSSSFSHVPVPIHSLSAEAKEQQALEYHIKGTMLEDSGHHQEALVYYRRAARLVPDIEFAAHRLTVQAQEAQESRAKRERETSDTREREQFDLQQVTTSQAHFLSLANTNLVSAHATYVTMLHPCYIHISSLFLVLLNYWFCSIPNSTDRNLSSLSMLHD